MLLRALANYDRYAIICFCFFLMNWPQMYSRWYFTTIALEVDKELYWFYSAQNFATVRYYMFKSQSSLILSNLITKRMLSLLHMKGKPFIFFPLCHSYPVLPLSSCRHTAPRFLLRHAGTWASLATCCAAPVTCSGSSASPSSSPTAGSAASRRPRWKRAR